MDDTRSRQVVIAGAGIAGLTAALAFAERGYAVRVFEQAPRLEAAGAGIQLSPNATHILDRLGVLDLLLPAAVLPKAVILQDAATLRQLARVPLGAAAGEKHSQAPYLVVHRADLQSALMACVARTTDIHLATGAAVRDIAIHKRGIAASIDIDGNTVGATGFLLIGADGVWSSARALSGDPARSRFSGELAWRATVRADSPAGVGFRKIAAADCVTTFLHPGFHLVAYPVRGGAAYNLVALTRGEEIAEGWSRKADASVPAAATRNIAAALASLVEQAGPWTVWPIHMVDVRQKWTAAGCIALIGDAAHAMTPFAAQGAAMAIEDAYTLAGLVAASPADLAGALADWEKSRRPRIARVIRRGAINRLAWHAAGPVALARNLFLNMRSSHKLAGDLNWLYGWRPPMDDDK